MTKWLIQRWRPFLLAFMVATFIILLCLRCLTFKETYHIYVLEDNWTVSINGDKHEFVSLYNFYEIMDRKLQHGDIIVMSTTLPKIERLNFPVLLFRSRYTTLDVYLDKKHIYSFGNDLYNNEAFIGKTYHFISLPTEYMGKKLTFRMVVGENDAFTSLASVRLGSQPDIQGEFIHNNMIIMFTGMFLLVFGVAFFCITMFYVTSVKEIRSFLFSSMFCMNLGAWIMTYYSVLSPFVYTPLETQIEYFTLYLIVPYCFLICYHIQNIKNKKLYITAALLSVSITLIQYVLHYGFNIHLRATLPMYHICCVAGATLMIFYIIKNMKYRDLTPSASVQMFGLVCFSVAEVFHLFLYIIEHYHIRYPEFLSILSIAWGCLMFAFCQLANYLLFITQSYAQQQENASLTHLAYADGLTNLPNRARSDKEMQDLNQLNTDYCIISVDLNGLKYVNDEFGHPTGDKYIKDFSKVLTSTFEEHGFCSRIGGDEFLVIIKNSEGKDIPALIGRMESALNVMNALYSEYHRSVATGYAYRHECTGEVTSHEVYLLADERMYENKRRMHEELGIRQRL